MSHSYTQDEKKKNFGCEGKNTTVINGSKKLCCEIFFFNAEGGDGIRGTVLRDEMEQNISRYAVRQADAH